MKIYPMLLLCVMASGLAYADDKVKEEFRDYDGAKDHVKAFYKEHHEKQTYGFAVKKREEYNKLNHGKYTMWEVMELLDKVVDESDPDLELPQIQHALQVAEAMRADGQPEWLIVTGLIHDSGKLLATWGEPQWAVVGDTYPVGCRFSDKIVLSDYLEANADKGEALYCEELGVYEKRGVGLKNVVMSWGHDEYLYQVVKDQSTLPEVAKFVIRFHSFYPLHREGEYEYLMDDEDRMHLPWLKEFNKYDLYSKSEVEVDVEKLRPYYQRLLRKYFPGGKINW